MAFASGCAATTTILHTLSAGDHVVAGDDLYGGTYRIFERVMKQLGISVSYVDPMRPAAFGEALRPNTKLVWVETPTNPLLKLCDIAEVAKLCHAAKLPLFVDNTFMSPVLQRPLELGATAVVHSTTKYINGHADVVGGVVVTSDVALHERLRFLQNAIGAVPGPLDCFLVTYLKPPGSAAGRGAMRPPSYQYILKAGRVAVAANSHCTLVAIWKEAALVRGPPKGVDDPSTVVG